MLPEGATPFAGKNNEDVAVKFDQEGVYGVSACRTTAWAWWR